MYASDLKHPSPTLGKKLEHIYTLGRKTINPGFRAPFLELLQKFGDPHKNLPPVIHVAGTNGKGSIIAVLRAALEEAGYKVHAYTSPHLCAFNERIVLAGENITDDFLESLIDEALEYNGNADITFFELTTALAFAAFARTPADILLLEVGLGGRLDCTNIIDKPLVSIIGSVSYDHMEFLGDSLHKIAGEKGGIIKPGVPCVIGAQNPESQAAGVVKILSTIAISNGAPLSRSGAEWFTHENGDVFKFVHKDVEMILPRPNLQGSHQISNAGAAIAALEIIGDQFPVSPDALKSALQKIRWPARLQNLTKEFELKDGWELWLDGGHNDDAAQALSLQAEQWARADDKKLHLVLGMMKRKDPAGFVKILQNHLSSVSFIDIPGEPQAHSGPDMLKRVKSQLPGLDSATQVNITAAVKNITANNSSGRILIAGSLYLAGHVLKSCVDKR
ncbi:MAG: bifunctional folylpolyglutamate synthase/dihydrofolate synthase [Alphaproteobacteria bacterium PRO2]|nr:bifunctional folylpolyglutamate synthase/dihydrofolate synthase [Alphaproteobacteria bacterium PRO2]